MIAVRIRPVQLVKVLVASVALAGRVVLFGVGSNDPAAVSDGASGCRRHASSEPCRSPGIGGRGTRMRPGVDETLAAALREVRTVRAAGAPHVEQSKVMLERPNAPVRPPFERSPARKLHTGRVGP